MSETGDTIVHYTIGKTTDEKVDMAVLCNLVLYHIQNNEIYFSYEVQFYNGKIIFGIVGLPEDHEHLQKVLGEKIKKIGCLLSVSAKTPFKGEKNDQEIRK